MLALLGAAPDPIVAERGGDAVTVSEARALIAGADADTRRKLATDPAALSDLLRNYLLSRAILEEARAQHWDQKPDIAAQAQRAHDNVVAQSFLASQAVPPASFPDEAEIKASYDANRAQLMQPRGYHLTQVYLAADAASADEARRKLADVRTQVAHGRTSFETAARRVVAGQYGDLGWLPENRLQVAARDAVSGLLEGQMSEPVCTAAGCTLLKLIATRPAGPAPLAEVRDGLVKLLRQQKERAGEQAYANTLLGKQPVRVNEIELSHLTQQPK